MNERFPRIDEPLIPITPERTQILALPLACHEKDRRSASVRLYRRAIQKLPLTDACRSGSYVGNAARKSGALSTIK
jgi:hypothetical protein